jgi:DNA invertase Pin-like site-specific DNA recombinase
MKRDAAERKFDRVLAWKVSRLGRDMRRSDRDRLGIGRPRRQCIPCEVSDRADQLDHGEIALAIQAWFAETEDDERSEAIRAGQVRARATGALVGRPRVIFDRDAVVTLRDDAYRSWSEIAKELHVSSGIGAKGLLCPEESTRALPTLPLNESALSGRRRLRSRVARRKPVSLLNPRKDGRGSTISTQLFL